MSFSYLGSIHPSPRIRDIEAPTGGVLQKTVLKDFGIFTGKHVLDSLFNKNAGLQGVTLTQVFCCEYDEIYKNTFFGKHLRTAASGDRHTTSRF